MFLVFAVHLLLIHTGLDYTKWHWVNPVRDDEGWQFIMLYFQICPHSVLQQPQTSDSMLMRNKHVCLGNDVSAEPAVPAVSVCRLTCPFLPSQSTNCVFVFSMGVFMLPHPTRSCWSLHSVLFALVSGWDMWHCPAFPVKEDPSGLHSHLLQPSPKLCFSVDCNRKKYLTV